MIVYIILAQPRSLSRVFYADPMYIIALQQHKVVWT